MARISQQEARRRWEDQIRLRNWTERKVRLVMFDYHPDKHGRTAYKPAPGWPTIAADDDTAELEEYIQLEARLLEQGEPFSQRGSRRHGPPMPVPAFEPLPIIEEQVVSVIAGVMSVVQPCAVTQEQILRAAFFARLPQELAAQIGTVRSGVHPERPTPSSDYSFTGKRKAGMRARYDLGFGDPVDSAGITGVGELKAGNGSFDRLRAFGRLVDENGDPPTVPTQEKKREEPLIVDFLKLLDPKLPQGSFRISWIALGRRGFTTAAEIRERRPAILKKFDEFESTMLPAAKGYSVIAQEMDGYARDAHLVVDGVKFREKEIEGRNLTELTLESRVGGDYHGIVNFLNHLQRSKNVYIVDGLSVDTETPGQGAPAGNLRITLHLRTFFRKV
jgi:hypothetical protein